MYCLRGRGLLPVHGDGVADPYLKLTLGPQTLGDSRSAVKDTLDPDFFKMYEFSTTLPGESLLKVS